MNQFSWPVAILAVITLLAGAVVGDALRAAAGGSATSPGGGLYIAAASQP